MLSVLEREAGMQTTIAEITQTNSIPPSWSVEMIDEDGGIEIASFSGPEGRARAAEYARWKYGVFRHA